MLIGMFEEEKPKGPGEKLLSTPVEQTTINTQEHLYAHVVLTGPKQNLDAQMFLFHSSGASMSSLFRFIEVCLRYYSRSNQSREKLHKCVHIVK